MQSLSSGGSSGGEGAFQALRGSAVGFGTDIGILSGRSKDLSSAELNSGGSVLIPSAFNGVYSIKPSSGRISTKNMANSVSHWLSFVLKY